MSSVPNWLNTNSGATTPLLLFIEPISNISSDPALVVWKREYRVVSCIGNILYTAMSYYYNVTTLP